MFKKIAIGIGFILFFALGLWLRQYLFQWHKLRSEESAQVLLERVQTVAKLITVEGYFSEVYDYKDYYAYNLSPFRKKALIRVKAKVSVGYDLSRVEFETRPDEKVIIVRNLPKPEILSIDHDLDYYDISQGMFNSFSAQDYTKLSQRAKEYVEEKALESPLFDNAEKQGAQILDMMRFMVEQSGWRFEYQNRKGLLDMEKLME